MITFRRVPKGQSCAHFYIYVALFLCALAFITSGLSGCAGVVSGNSAVQTKPPAPTPLSIAITSLPAGTTQAGYSATLTASGGTAPYKWSVTTGSLPAGLTISSSGQISGTPTQAGTFSFTLQVTDSSSPAQSASANPSIVVNSAQITPLTIAITSLPAGTTQAGYSATLTAGGGTTPYKWSVTTGSLPAGLTISSSGQISGTPTQAGTFSFTLQVTDSSSPAQSASTNLSIVIKSASSGVQITTSAIQSGQVSVPCPRSLSASGGTTPYTWSLNSGSLPAGLTLNTSGQISGTPTAAGTSTFTVSVADSSAPAQTASNSLSMSVAPAPTALQIATTSLPNGQAGSTYAVALSATGGVAPYTWKILTGTLPAGLSLAPSTGLISGTPTSSGSSTFTVQVTDSTPSAAQSASQPLTLAVNPSAGPTQLSVAAVTTVQPALQGQAYNPPTGPGNGGGVLNISGGTGPYKCWVSSGSLPPGMSIVEVTPTVTPAGLCVLQGTPSAAGDFTFTVQVTDSASNTASQSVSFIVVASSGRPAISGVTATQTSSTSETITWTTSVAADSSVDYGPTDDYELATPVQDTGGVTSHSVLLTGLLPGQQYSFRVRSRGISGGAPHDYLSSFQNGNAFNVAGGSTSGTLDFVLNLQGPHNVVQGYPIYVGVGPYITSGTSSYQNSTLKFQITNIPPNTQVHWPDEQDNGYGGNGCSISTTTTANDTMKCYGFEGTQFDLLTNVGGTTPVGTYTLTVAVSINGGAVSHSQTYPVNVTAVPSFPSGSPSSQPPIPSLALWQTNMLTYGAKWSTGCPVAYDGGVSYYDGIRVYQRISAYTNNLITWNPLVSSIITCYRDGYVLPNNGGLSGYWVFPHGLYYDCLGGSTTSCTALHALATNAAGASMTNGGYVPSTRVREACYMLGAKRLDYDAGGGSTLAQVKQMAAYCLGAEDQIVNNNAYYPFENFFMDGLLAQALIEYWADPKTGNGDPRIPGAIKALADHIWSVGWIPWSGGNGEFLYNLFQFQAGMGAIFPQTQGESLNLLIVPMFAWLYRNTGLQQYQLEGDTIWNAGVNDPPDAGIGWSGKNFSQQYRWSFDYVTWRSLP